MFLQTVRPHRRQAASRRTVNRLMPLGIQTAQQPGILHDNRQHPGQRPEPNGADKNQPPDSHIDAAQHVEQAAHQQGDEPRNNAAHNVARREKREQQGDDRCGKRPGENNRQGNGDLREVIAKRPVEKVVPDEHPQ